VPIATGLLIVSGVAGVVLTVWGRVRPPDSQATKRGFVALGGLGVVCIVAAGILNSFSQDRLSGTIAKMATDVAKLAAPASVDPKLTPDQILSAAAAKLIEQQDRITKLEAQQREDHSAKRMIRDLLTRVDSHIPAAIDLGMASLHFRMQPQDFDALARLANQTDAGNLIRILRGTRFESTNSMNCGAPGGICPEPQVDVVIEAFPALKQ
jgi:hypothetical protein